MSQEEERPPWRARLSRKTEHSRFDQPVNCDVSGFLKFFSWSARFQRALAGFQPESFLDHSRQDAEINTLEACAPIAHGAAVRTSRSAFRLARIGKAYYD
jgi:hypothetical protein